MSIFEYGKAICYSGYRAGQSRHFRADGSAIDFKERV